MSAAWVAKQHGKRLKKTSFTAHSWPRPSARRAGAQSGESRRTHPAWSRMPDGPVTPRAASSADRSPSAAARPTWKGFPMFPNDSWMPASWAAASPTARSTPFASRPRSRAHAAAAPSRPSVAVACHPAR